MITEAQRRALFALREALHLCDQARITVEAHEAQAVRVSSRDFGCISLSPTLNIYDVDRLLAMFPEPV
jgi:hypothetical protein